MDMANSFAVPLLRCKICLQGQAELVKSVCLMGMCWSEFHLEEQGREGVGFKRHLVLKQDLV